MSRLLLMRAQTRLALLLSLSLCSCHTVGVEVSDQALKQSLGLSADQLRELYGVPHLRAVDSDGVEVLGYGLEHRALMSLDAEAFVEFMPP